MSSKRNDLPIPDMVKNPKTQRCYTKGKFLGKGGFARCYELTDVSTNQIMAGKIVPKALLKKPHQREKMAQEIDIHKSLSHHHIVKFFDYFEDNDFVYILLELCRRRSLMELHKRRRAVTEPEARYFVYQIVSACEHLHSHRIIHRDLKLGNLFLNDEMDIKIGDFGLATRIDYEGERKRTLCGTPNYIAPEVLGKKGHSYEVDAWSLGCIVYTLLVGKPPFETSSLQDTYLLIKKNEYHIPSTRVSSHAKALIQRLLKADPTSRPSMTDVLKDPFFTAGFMPAGLPTSCLTLAPRFDMLKSAGDRRPLHELNGMAEGGSQKPGSTKSDRLDSQDPGDYYLGDLLACMTQVMATKPNERLRLNDDDNEDPAAIPIYWISKWVDYSDKYGLGYQLCDNSIGVLYNDSTRLLLTRNGENVQYIERDGREHFHTLRVFPDPLMKKVTLLKYFRNYMNEHLLKAGANMVPREGDEMTRLPFLRTWFRTRSAIVMHLSNGTLQMNFFADHTKLIVCPLMQAVTYIDEKRDFHTYRLSLIEKNGCSKDLASRLKYARTMAERLVTSKSSAKSSTSAKPAPSSAASATRQPTS